MRYKITCVERDGRGQLLGIGTETRHWSKQEALALIRSGRTEFYVQQPGTKPASLVIEGQHTVTVEPVRDPRNTLECLAEFAWQEGHCG